MISSRQLECFRAVARELHFTRAAQTLRIAQPALSQQIRKMERQLGLVLFERNNHRVELTAAGEALLLHAERILSDLGAVEEEMLCWGQGIRGRIRLGAARSLTEQLARLLAAFCGNYPSVEVELREQNTAEMIEGLHAGRLDAATLAGLPPRGDRRLESRPLGEEPLVLVTRPESRLAGELAGLDGVDLVQYPSGSAIGEIIRTALAEAGVSPRSRFEIREPGTARAMVSVGLAAAILPRSLAESPGPPVRIVALEPDLTWTPSLAWSATRRTAPALTAFLEFVIEHPELAGLAGQEHASQ